jgi:hypothetical protein
MHQTSYNILRLKFALIFSYAFVVVELSVILHFFKIKDAKHIRWPILKYYDPK